ncbi:retropepsin-like aspartic protease, partial [Klebsiella pneumoniae]|nr:retropepsin-like aspartic protease [Klebsiella pneumoniae]
ISADTPSHPKEKKKVDRNLHPSSPNTVTPEEPNDISASDAETQSGDEHEPNDNINNDVHVDAQPSNDRDVEIEPVDLDNPQPKNRRYDKNDFTARQHGKEREPWVQKPMPFPPKPSKKKDDEDFERFVEMISPVFLQMCLTYMLKMSPYAKYMKDNVTNKRRIPEVEISTMLANYTFKGGTPKKLGDPGVPTIPCSIKGNYVRTALCDLEAGVSVMPLSLYRRLELDKLTPTEISLHMADKSTDFPIGICKDVPVVVANTTILTDFVILDIPGNDAMVVIPRRPFLNTAGAVIDCNKGNVTFHVNGNEHTMHFPKKPYQVHCINAIEKISSILIGSFECPIPRVKMKYDLLVGEIHIHIEVT